MTGVGEVVTDTDGMTLYRFDSDTAKPPRSNCENDCSTTRPPVLANGPVAVQGVDARLVGTVTRADGSQQVTLNGWPLYRYAKDTGKGEAKGQGGKGTWFAVTAIGGKANAPAVAQNAPSGDASAAINTTNIDGLGTVLTDQNGWTLYRYTKDDKDKHVSNRNGACATSWPPLLATGDTKINGIDPELAGKTKRADGTEQVTVGGWPVCRYAKDTAPGQANGHNAGGVWFTIETGGCEVSEDKRPVAAAAGSANTPAWPRGMRTTRPATAASDERKLKE